MKDPYQIVKSRYITEKTTMLGNLHTANSNPSLARCKSPKYVFEVDMAATKADIARAIEQIFKKNEVKVIAVNTLRTKRKTKRRGRAPEGRTVSFKKAIVTLQPGDLLEVV